MPSRTAWECVRASEGARARRSSAPGVAAQGVTRVRCRDIACVVLAALIGGVAPDLTAAAAFGAAVPDTVALRRSVATPDSIVRQRLVATPDAETGAGSVARPDSIVRQRSALMPFQLVAVAELIGNGVASGELVEPSGIVVDAFGHIYIGDAARHRVLRLDQAGAVLGQTGSLGSDEGELRRPGSVVLLGTLSVAVLDVENRRVLMYDVNDRLQGTLIDFDEASLRDVLGRVEPRSLAADFGRALYVADAERDRVLAFDFSGRLSRVIGGFGEAPGSFRELAAVAATRRGALITLERTRFRVQHLDAAGVPVTAWTFADSLAARGDFAIAVDESLRVAVADGTAGTVGVWDRDGRRLASLAGLGRPRSLAFAPDGTLLIAEAALGRLRRFRLERTPPQHPADE